jgi:hypothetical protein
MFKLIDGVMGTSFSERNYFYLSVYPDAAIPGMAYLFQDDDFLETFHITSV